MKYIGNGNSLPNIPARDLTDEEVKRFGEKMLIKSGLYEVDKPIRQKYSKDKEAIKE